MDTVALTEKLLLNAGGWEALTPARTLHQTGRVSEARYDPPLLTGLVREGGRNYRAGLRVNTAVDVENICTCRESRSSGKICAHSVAVGLAHLAPALTKPTSLAPSTEKPASHKAAPTFVVEPSENIPAAKLTFILPPNFTAAWERGQLMLVAEAESGGRRLLVSALGKTTAYACDGSDLAALEGLRQFPDLFVSGMITLNRAQFLSLLPALQNHPRVTFGKTVAVKISSATFTPILQLHQKSASQLSARVELPINSAMLLDGTAAWLLRQNEFIPCAEGLTTQSAALLQEPRVFEGDRALRFLALELPTLRHVFEIRGDTGVALPQVLAATPVFALRVAGTLNQLTAELHCHYADRPPFPAAANSEDNFAFRDPGNPVRLLTRNLPAETEAIARLERSGFARTDSVKTFSLRGQAQVVRFFAAEYARLQRAWTVTLTAQVAQWSGEMEQVRPKLEVVASGQDWFELRYSLATSGGQEFSSAEVQQLLRSGQTQARLPNGRLALFDTEGLEDFQQVMRDCDPTQNQPGLYRIDRAHAAYIEATARDSGSTLIDRREALRNFVVSGDNTPARADLPQKLGSLVDVLRAYQMEGVAWLWRLADSNLGGILADEMGLGKTLQALAFLRANRGAGPALIVCPTSLVTNWQNEAGRFTPELKSLVLEGAERAQRFHAIPQSDIVVTSYALLRRDIEELRKFEFSTAILDEAQHIKNPETQNAQAACAVRARTRFVLTGTPMENSVRDLWSLMNFVVPGYLGPRGEFRERYEQPLARGSAPDVQRRLSRRLKPFLLRRKKRDVAQDLPEKIEQVISCDLTNAQRSAYDALLREIQQGLASDNKNGKSGAVRMQMLTGLLRLRQVCCDLRLLRLDKPGHDTSAKLDLLDELLEEAIDGEHRVLLFSQFVSMLHLIRERLGRLKIPFCYLDGQTKQRQEVVDRFQSDLTIPVFLISLKAGGVGLNLSGADAVIHFDPWWNPAVEAQATDRAHRIGQTRVVTAYKLIARGTVEEKILRLQEKKRAAIDAAIDSEEPLMAGLTTEELEELLS